MPHTLKRRATLAASALALTLTGSVAAPAADAATPKRLKPDLEWGEGSKGLRPGESRTFQIDRQLDDRQWAALSPEEKGAYPVSRTFGYKQRLKSTTTNKTSGVTVTCYTASWYQDFSNIYGTAWTWTNTMNWCYDGLNVTSVGEPIIHVGVAQWATAMGWNYDGVIDGPRVNTYPSRFGGTDYQVYTQAKFTYCPPRIFCPLLQQLPYLTIALGGNGTSWAWGGGA